MKDKEAYWIGWLKNTEVWERLRGGCPKIKLFKQNFSSLKGGNKKFQSQALGIEPYMLQNTVNFFA